MNDYMGWDYFEELTTATPATLEVREEKSIL